MSFVQTEPVVLRGLCPASGVQRLGVLVMLYSRGSFYKESPSVHDGGDVASCISVFPLCHLLGRGKGQLRNFGIFIISFCVPVLDEPAY